MTKFVKLPNGAVLVDGWDRGPRDLRADLETWLVSTGECDAFDAEVRAGRAIIGRTWWSDTYNGQTHSCAEHQPNERGRACFDDARPVTILAEVGTWD
jgi:hypothetical protein